MPIFFHLQAHLWIAYLFFFNGLVLALYLMNKSKSFANLIRPLEALLLTAFFLSIGLNAICLLILDLLGLPFNIMRWGLLCITVMITTLTVTSSTFKFVELPKLIEISFIRLFFYFLVFLILFYNGGLIDQISDAWWHMSLANKISLASSLSPEHGHLNGVSERYYPPLWHANLALANSISNISIPVFWNAFTAWGAVLKVMGFYLLAWSLHKDKSFALLAAVLFFVLPGMGDSYMRVSAWPSHIAYTGLFGLFYLVFNMLDKHHGTVGLNGASLFRFVASLKSELMVLLYLLLIVWFSHQLEVLWFAVGMFVYSLSLLVHQALAKQATWFVENNQLQLDIVSLVGLLFCIVLSLMMLAKILAEEHLRIDLVVSYGLPLSMFIGLLYCLCLRHFSGRWFRASIACAWLLLIVAGLIVSVDFHHLVSLFKPELAYPASRVENYAVVTSGVFGHELALPGWHLQLRQAFLYSGLISIPLSLFLAIVMPSRLSLFTAGTAVVVFLFTTSPYLYQWLVDITGYHSPWRVATLLFHPIAFAALLFLSARVLRESSRV